jgi:RNA polymerase sigma-70 factor (ECF subfamily)
LSTSANEEVKYDFQALCTPHYQALLNYASRLLQGRPQEARDLVQEAYLKAYRKWSTWKPAPGEDPSSAARGFLHRIVLNAFLDDVRAHAGRRKLLDNNHEVVVEQTYGVEADHNIQVLSDGIGDEVRRALAELDKDQRDVVERADFAGEQYLAISEALGIPLGTVMSRLHRARKKLSTSLKGYAREEYGISKSDAPKVRRPRLAVGTESDCSDATALTDVPPETPES